jgi:ribonuclease HI
MSKNNQKFYVIWVGRKPGIYDNWSEAFKQVEKFNGAKYKSFTSEQDAREAFSNSPNKELFHNSKKQPINEKKIYTDTRIESNIHIYCDGGCEPNPGECSSGIVIYKDNTLASLYYGLYQKNGTNNIAELLALLHSLKFAQSFLEQGLTVQILCDSKYSIDCITNWSYKWKENNWTKKGDEIKNLDMIKEAHHLYDGIKEKITISHIKGHANFEGNELADRMTNLGIKNKEESLKKYQEDIVIKEILKD